MESRRTPSHRPLLAGLLLALGLSLPAGAAAEEPVLTAEEAAVRGRAFLDLLRKGDGASMYARLDPFSRLRWSEEQFQANVQRLLDQYGAIQQMELKESRDGRPFFHVYYDVTHKRSAVLYHLTLSISGAVMRFEVEAVDGQPLKPPEAPPP